MKKIFILIAFLLAVKSYSQHPELLDTEWHLHKIVIGGNDIYPPNVEIEPEKGMAFFYEDKLITYFCDGLDVSITYYSEDKFLLEDDGITTIGVCAVEENTTFNVQYFSVIYYSHNILISYNITTDSEGNKLLVIINPNNDEAHYGNAPLSVTEFSQTQLTLYPNPVTGVLYINSLDVINTISVFDIYGKAVKTVSGLNNNSSEIDLSHLQSGVYFIKVQTVDNRLQIRSFIKR